jgi:hypothetical protein
MNWFMYGFGIGLIAFSIVGLLWLLFSTLTKKMNIRTIPLYRYKCSQCDYVYTSPGSNLTKSRAVVHQMDVHDKKRANDA